MSRTLFIVLAVAFFGLASAQNLPFNVDFGWTSPQPMVGMYGDGNEYFLRETMQGGQASFAWNKSANTVDLHIIFNGLPGGRICYEHDPTTPFNFWPMCVSDGKWRFTIVHHLGLLPIKLFYDANDQLLGTEYDYYGHGDLESLPNLTTEYAASGMVMIMTPHAVVTDGKVDQTFRFRYDQFLNFLGTTGIALGKANFTRGDITTKHNIYSNPNALVKPLPAFSWEDILNDWATGGGLAVLPTLHPAHEPANLAGRDNLLRGPIAQFGAGLAGQFGPRLFDTPTCWASQFGTPAQKAEPWKGNIQLGNWFGTACVAPGQGY